MADFFSSAYATEDEAQAGLRLYVDTDLDEGTVEWEWEDMNSCVEANGKATVKVETCEESCLNRDW